MNNETEAEKNIIFDTQAALRLAAAKMPSEIMLSQLRLGILALELFFFVRR